MIQISFILFGEAFIYTQLPYSITYSAAKLHRLFCRLAAFIAVFFVLAVLAACAEEASLTSNSTRARLALAGQPSTLDPHATTETLTFQVTRSIYDTLLDPSEGGELEPALAESWSVSNTNLNITFNLRKNVLFHNGEAFTSADVKASIERLQSPEFASPSAQEFAVIEEVLIIDDHTVQFNLSEASAPLLYTLASGWAAMLPASLIQEGHNFAREALGTGPFVLKEWVADEEINLVKNPNYWKRDPQTQEDLPYLEAVDFLIIPERAVQVQSLLAGRVDILYAVNEEDIPTIQAAGNASIEQLETAVVLVLTMNTSKDSLSDLRLRQAIAHSIDKQQVLNVAYGGGTVVGTFNDSTSAFYEDFTHVYPFDRSRARALLEQTQYDTSRVFDLVLPQAFAGVHVRAGEMYQEMLRLVGIRSEIRLVDWPTWITEVYGNANYDLTVIGHTGKLDPDGRFIGYGTSDMYVRWENEEVRELIDRGRQTLAPEERREIYREVQRIFAEELPFVYVGTPLRTIAYAENLQGFVITPNLDTFDFRRLRFLE